MDKGWDRSGIAYDVSVWSECLRVLKPGGHLLAFGGSRTYHRLACAIENAGFEIRDQIQWIYGCLSDDTEILINGQWEPYHKAVKGSPVLCYNLDRDTFEWQPVQDLYVYQYSDTAYRIQSASTDQIVSRNHRCIVERSGAYTFGVAEEVAREREARVPVLENVSAVLDAFCMLDQRASCSERDVLSVMHSEGNLDRKEGENKTSFGTEGAGDYLCGVSQEEMEAGCRASQGGNANVLISVQREIAEHDANQKQVRQNRNEVSRHGIKGRQESGVEGRRHVLSETRQLQAHQVCALPAAVSGNGPQRRLRDGAPSFSGPSHRTVSASTGSGPSRRSRSGQQQIDELPSVCHEPRAQTVRASRFTRPDLARITPFHYDGVVWCVRVPSGAFVARRNGKVFITGNSGFPKSLNVARSIDSELCPVAGRHFWSQSALPKGEKALDGDHVCDVTAEGLAHDEQGTALKPAHEPIVLARKLLIGTVAENVLQHGTGGLNIDGCRVETDWSDRSESWKASGFGAKPTTSMFGSGGTGIDTSKGRWPANVIHDGSDEVLSGFPQTDNSKASMRGTMGESPFSGIDGSGRNPDTNSLRGHDDNGGSAARFFYCAKSSQEDRNEGLEDLPMQSAGAVTDRKDESAGLNSPRAGAGRNSGSRNPHPTVKPTDLMRYLCRLVTPPNGTVLDPFCGSGSTGKAAVLEGLRFIGVELSAEYCELARRRIKVQYNRMTLYHLIEAKERQGALLDG
jgi:site-specific DNA-methyltransferase (adenine-specific)